MKNENYTSMLKDIHKDNTTLESIFMLPVKFENYIIKDEYLYGTGKREIIKLSTIFKKNNKVGLILDLIDIGNEIYSSKDVKKEYYESLMDGKDILCKPHIYVDIKTINSKIENKIIEFFNKYGMVQSEKCNLRVFLRRVIEFYCIIKILDKIDEKDIDSIEDEILFVLYPQYRRKTKDTLYQGIAANIQENGFLKNEEKSCVFEYFTYDISIKDFKMLKICNDYIVLAYYQLANLIISKKNGIILPKCSICGEYLNAERSNKEYCDSEECKKTRQRQRKAKSRKKQDNKKQGELI